MTTRVQELYRGWVRPAVVGVSTHGARNMLLAHFMNPASCIAKMAPLIFNARASAYPKRFDMFVFGAFAGVWKPLRQDIEGDIDKGLSDGISKNLSKEQNKLIMKVGTYFIASGIAFGVVRLLGFKVPLNRRVVIIELIGLGVELFDSWMTSPPPQKN